MLPSFSTSQLKLHTTLAAKAKTPTAEKPLNREENETVTLQRVERSALPILNENFSAVKSGPNNVHFPSEEIKEAAAGRYFQYNIKPTGTYEGGSYHTENPLRTSRARSAKILQTATEVRDSATAASSSNSFLLKGDLRPLTSGSPNTSSSTAISMTRAGTPNATVTPTSGSRQQNPNPDIQDIITGIVKLLNGNVNVHANTQGVRRPSATRINNRGPPRITDTQTLPLDYDAQKPAIGTSVRPPPYPFDRPERPFITGVPIPEQIVPYRPGFVSNRPPWHRNKPRPPISTSVGGRRPAVQQYKPMPSSQMSPPQKEQQTPEGLSIPAANQQPPAIPTQFAEDEATPTSAENAETVEAPAPTDTAYDSEFSNEEDANAQYIEVSDNEGEPPVAPTVIEEDLKPAQNAANNKKEDHKKKPHNKHKPADKKKPSGDDYTTIIATSSVVHTVMNMPNSHYMPMPMEGAENMDHTTEEVIFLTSSKTPALETSLKIRSTSSSLKDSVTASSSITTTPLGINEVTTSSLHRSTTIDPSPSNSASLPSTTTTSISSFNEPTTTMTTTTTTSNTPSLPASSPTPPPNYQPRPGIVLDDPEFKPGGRLRPRPSQAVQQQPLATQIQPTRQHLPPGYGEIFDVTLSAIQGPGTVGGSSQQTINIKPYGSYGSGSKPGNGLQQSDDDIISSASGEDGFVSIDGKRTYINLFGDPTDAPQGVPLTTPASAIAQLPGTSGTSHSVANPNLSVGAGYGVPDTEVVPLQPTKSQNTQTPAAQSPTTHAGPTRPHYRQRPTQPPVRIDTCIVGDDTTCDQAQHERCKTDNGVSSCHCRPGKRSLNISTFSF